MPGDRWQQLANLRAYLGFMFGHPGKKLLFMGCEFAQDREWNHDQSLDWHLLDNPEHAGIQRLGAALNHLYRSTPALYMQDCVQEGFEWVDHGDAGTSILSFIRRGTDPSTFVLVVSNFTPTIQQGYRLGVPELGQYRERLNSDSTHYGGSNTGTPNGAATAQAQPWHGKPYSIALTIPPLATVILEWTR